MIFDVRIVDKEFEVASVAFLLCVDDYLTAVIDGALCNIGGVFLLVMGQYLHMFVFSKDLVFSLRFYEKIQLGFLLCDEIDMIENVNFKNINILDLEI